MDRKEIAAVLASAGNDGGADGGMRPKHQFGQNFMVDQNILKLIVDAGQVGEQDVVLEVGPGVGNLTRQIAQRAQRGAVLAVDIDRHLLPAAKRHHASLTNVTWLLADVLAGKHQIEPRVLETLRELRTRFPAGELKLVSNLPYNAASPLIAELLVEMWREWHPAANAGSAATSANATNAELSPSPSPLFFSRMAFTVQWEVAQRMNARCNTRDYGPLGILMQSLANVDILRKIPPGAFWPPPKIQSALVVVTPAVDRIRNLPDAPAFQKLLAGIFSHRRQTLGNALKHFCGDAWQPAWKSTFSATGFDLSQRPENLSIAELIRLAQHVNALAPHRATGANW